MTTQSMTSTSSLPNKVLLTCVARVRKERAQAIIENCVHPDYKNILWDYLKLTDGKSQTPQAARAALAMHAELAKSGNMQNVDWAQYK